MLRILVAWVVCAAACNALLSGSRFTTRRPQALRASATKVPERLFEKDPKTLQALNSLEDSHLRYRTSEEDELAALRYQDVALADNFYEATLPRTKKLRSAAISENNIEKRLNIDSNFYDLMNMGFERRLASKNGGMDIGTRDSRFAALHTAAQFTGTSLELGKTKEEQIKDLRRQRLNSRPSYMKVIPQSLHKYVDYFLSLRIQPEKSELTKNVALGGFFSFVVWVNQSARSSFMYFVVGNLAILSSLLTRNMPSREITPGMDKNKKVAGWSPTSFKTAAAITILTTVGIALMTLAVSMVLPITLDSKFKTAMFFSMLGVSYFTSFFEVFEEKSKNGWRWRKAVEGELPDDPTRQLTEGLKETELKDLYEYEYDPEIDEYPRKPKYIDEIDGSGDPTIAGGSGEIDEPAEQSNYEEWKVWRKDSRRPPVEEAAPETPWVGSREGMYVNKFPNWLKSAYNKNVLNANQWRNKPLRFIKDYQEFEMIEGPVGFRDKRPSWFGLFGTGVWEEKVTASRRAARSFGAYRKSMFKVDDKVQLLPCDGADKGGPGSQSKK